MRHVKIYFGAFLYTSLALLSSCAHGCEQQHSQKQLDEMYKAMFYPGAIPDFEPPLGGKVMTSQECKYIEGDTVAKKVFSSFEFINKEHYILYSCTHKDVFIAITALPKYLAGYYDEDIDGICSPKFNPLGLRSYSIEMEANTNEIVELRRIVD